MSNSAESGQQIKQKASKQTSSDTVINYKVVRKTEKVCRCKVLENTTSK